MKTYSLIAEREIAKIDKELAEQRKALALVSRPSRMMVLSEIDRLLDKRNRYTRAVN